MRSPDKRMRGTSLTYREMEKYNDELQKHLYMCKCGHKTMIRFDEIKALCSWCGNYVYKDKKDEFKDRMRGKLNGLHKS